MNQLAQVAASEVEFDSSADPNPLAQGQASQRLMALVLINTRWGVSGSAGLWRLSRRPTQWPTSMLLPLIRRSTALSVQALLLWIVSRFEQFGVNALKQPVSLTD